MTGRNHDGKTGRQARLRARDQQWVRPMVRRLSAGSAEDAAGGDPDGGLDS